MCFSVVCDRIAVESKQQGGSTMAEETIQRVLKQYYGHTAFRPGQEELIQGILAGRDALGVMPTGGGKS